VVWSRLSWIPGTIIMRPLCSFDTTAMHSRRVKCTVCDKSRRMLDMPWSIHRCGNPNEAFPLYYLVGGTCTGQRSSHRIIYMSIDRPLSCQPTVRRVNFRGPVTLCGSRGITYFPQVSFQNTWASNYVQFAECYTHRDTCITRWF
jgi:hypothetical protein